MYKEPVNDYQRAVDSFKREFLARTLAAHGGNRTRSARALGLQRTYLLRLIREFGLAERIPAPGRRYSASAVGK
jgi:DNA-binding NtrC family response regulator